MTGLTAIEAWMLACILFVFGTLAEYAAILFAMGLEPEKPVADQVHEDANRKLDSGSAKKLDTVLPQRTPQPLPHMW